MNTILGSPVVMLFIVAAIFITPAWRIVKRTGYSGAWSLLAFVPVINLVAIWCLAFIRWPAVDSKQ